MLRQLVRPLVDVRMIADGGDYLERLCQGEEMVSTAVG
jgi:hypothetical protein